MDAHALSGTDGCHGTQRQSTSSQPLDLSQLWHAFTHRPDICAVATRRGRVAPRIVAIFVTYPFMLYCTYTQMQRANELAQGAHLMQGMTELAGSVAHDFNNMLTSVSGPACRVTNCSVLQVEMSADATTSICYLN